MNKTDNNVGSGVSGEVFRRDSLTGVMVSNFGTVIGIKGYPLKLKKDKNGYLKAHVRNGVGRYRWVGVHRLVARNFVVNANPRLFTVVNHKDEVKSNNHADNLEWCTNAYNLTYGTCIKRRLMTCDSRKLKNARKMICLCSPNGTKMFFRSRCAAARHIGCRTSDICSLISKKQLSVKGWHLENVSQWGKHYDVRKVRLEKDGVIKEWASLREAGRFIGATGSEVARIVDGKGMSVKGWHLPNVEVVGSTAKKEVSLEKNGEIRTWKSLSEAAKAIGGNSSTISKLLKGKRMTVLGWHLVGVIPTERKEKQNRRNRVGLSRKRVVLESNERIEEFDSIRRAAEFLGVSRSSVGAVVSGRDRSVRGWHLPGVTNFGKGERKITLCKGEETHTWDSLAEAARQIGCFPSSLCILLKGDVKSVHGWHLPEVTDYGKEVNRRTVCLTKGGIVREWQNLRQAAREIGASAGNLWKLLNSKSGTKHVKGWRLVKDQSI